MALSLLPEDFKEKLLKMIFDKVRFGEISITTPTGHIFHFKGTEAGPKADMAFSKWSVMSRALRRGDIGFGEDYIEGNWTTSNLADLLVFMTTNVEHIEEVFHGKWYSKLLFGLTNLLRTNTKTGSQKNIMAHYDVGNDFYKLWLDETMTYSSGIFDGNHYRLLKDAQLAKYHRILDKVEKPEAAILEIGCGWGGFAEEAAKRGHSVTCLTISKAQFDYATERLRKAKLDNHAQIKFEDYRDTKGSYDNIVSIEMFEAVGERYWPSYFGKIKECLKQDGKAVIQAITINDKEFEGYRKRSDFIRHYTFPGGMLPSLQRFKEEAEKAGLRCREIFTFGKDYATTLHQWQDRILAKADEIRKMGYSENFIRSWCYYICICIAGFTTSRTDVMQVELVHA
ncbi:MAG: class I SAM-dependent methyltransferase [Proteobacteria bacterium]|nr:class I SAM-dependent methyltransferase [Pseudomonadota bacterium]